MIEDKYKKLDSDLKAIKASLKKRDIKPVYLLYGDEDYFIDEIYNTIKKIFTLETQLNFKIYTETNFDLMEAERYISSFPIMSDNKLIVFKDIEFFRKCDTVNEKKHIEFIDTIEQYKEQNIILILDHLSIMKDAKASKYYNDKNGIYAYFKDNGVALELFKLSDTELNKYVIGRFAKAGKIIDKVLAAYIIRCCGNSLKNLYNECDKIIAFLTDKEVVNRIDVDKVLTRNVDDDIFDLTNMINNNNVDDALRLYGDLLSEGKKPQEIFSLISTNYKNLLIVKNYMEAGKSQNEIAKLMMQPPWMVNKLMVANKYTTIEGLKKRINRSVTLSIERFREEMDERMMSELLLMI